MKFVHTADLQIGYRQYGFVQREADLLAAAANVVDQAIQLKVDAVVIAGDLFDMIKPPASAVLGVKEQVQRLHDRNIQVFGIDGNHDISSAGWIHVCGIKHLTPTPIGMRDGVSIAGIDYCRPTVFMQQLRDMIATGTKTDVLVIHQSLAEMADYSTELSGAEIAPLLQQIGVRYLAMGDIHKYVEAVIGGVRMVYPGSTEVMAVDEPTDKTFSVVDITATEMRTMYYPIATRPFANYQLNTQADLDQLLAAVHGLPPGAEHAPLYVVFYPASAKDLRTRAEAALQEHQIMYRFHPLTDDASAFRVKLAEEGSERRGLMQRLHAAIAAFFDENAEEPQLIRQCLDNPDALDKIVKSFLLSKDIQ